MISRIIYYLKIMYPVSSWMGTFLTGLAIQWTFLRLSNQEVSWQWASAKAAFCLICFSLLIRIMDEFKDYEDDLKNFPDRPLPSGRVQKNDLLVLGGLCLLLPLGLTPWLELPLISLAAVYIYSFLMLKWFFIESKMRKSLPLAFSSHHPIVLFHFVYLFFVTQSLWPETKWSNSFIVLGLGLMFTNWEFSRKIRLPSEETAYTTYSKIWGMRLSTWLCIFFQITVQGIMLWILMTLKLPQILVLIYLLGTTYIVFQYLLFLKNKSSGLKLKSWAESFIILNILVLLMGMWL